MDNLRFVLKLEAIGDDQHALKQAKARGAVAPEQREKTFKWHGQRAWVAAITGLDDAYGFKREFIKGQRDYSDANSSGSRGVFIYYPLKSGLYEVNAPLTWKRVRRYFCRIEGETLIEIDRNELMRCLTSTI